MVAQDRKQFRIREHAFISCRQTVTFQSSNWQMDLWAYIDSWALIKRAYKQKAIEI